MFNSPSGINQEVLDYYGLKEPFPVEWPAELDSSDEDEDDKKAGIRRSRSRYSALERAASDRRTLIPGSQKTTDGKANLVQKDEPDPLGGSRSVVASLKQRGLPIDQDTRMRNRFLLSSTTFSPALFLSQTHADASTNELIQGLRFLEKSIDQKSASLKVLVETNFERFVRAKATIDNVYTEMRNQGMEPAANAAPPSPRGLRHSRQTSRLSGFHQRITSTSSINPPVEPSKNALRKETEYGVKGIKGSLLEVSQRAEDVWGPALGGRERESTLKAVADAIEKDRDLYQLGSELDVAAQQKNWERVVELYRRARDYASEATSLGELSLKTGQSLSDEQTHKLLVTGRMWSEVQNQIKSITRDIWRRLSDLQAVHQTQKSTQADEHMELIGILLDLGVEDNPIWVWLLSRYDNLKNKLHAVTDRSQVEIEVLRRRLATANPPSPEMSAAYLRSAARDETNASDNPDVLDFWKCVSSYVNKLLSLTDGLLGEVVDFWEAAKSFIDGDKQKALPVGYEGESRKHHRLSDAGVKDLANGAVELVSLIRDALHALFAESPTEDISSIFSPVGGDSPRTPATPIFSPSEGRLGNLDEKSLPPPSPKKGDAWEDFAFWPPHSNALCAVPHITKILVILGSGAGEMITLGPVSRNNAACDKIKILVSVMRERCVTAVALAWSQDSERCRYLEDWLRSTSSRNQTRMPWYFVSYERAVINGLQQILYFSEGITKSRALVTPPSTKNIQLVRQRFMDSISAVLQGMLQNSENIKPSDEDEWLVVSESFQNASGNNTMQASYTIDASNRNVRMLLTMSNLKALRNEYVPDLVSLFETSFTVKLKEESEQIHKKFNEVDRQVFQSYTKPTISYLTRTIKDGINAADWEPKTTRPEQVSPYVYASLMVLVNIHTEISTTVVQSGSSISLLQEVLAYLLENISQALLDGFKERKPNRYSLAALIQATLDTEFLAQTMSQYASKKVGEIQNEIYVELDKRTTNDARADLQKELGVMRGVLKKLRESSRNSFGCFKRPRSDRPKNERKDSEK